MTVNHMKLTELAGVFGNRAIDLFVCSASFERRCLSVPEQIREITPRKVLVGVNVSHRDPLKDSLATLHRYFSGRCEDVPLDSSDPIASADSLSQSLGKVLDGGAKRVLVDVSTFTRESLLILVGLLHARARPGDRVECVYAHARDYSVGDDPETKWLSKGIREVRSVLGFPGEIVPSRRTHLIVLVGFEDDRALRLIQECEPNVVSLGVADASEGGTRYHQPTNVARFRRMRSILQNVDSFIFRAYDPFKTQEALRAQADRTQAIT